MLNFKLEIRNEGTFEKFFLEEGGKKQEERQISRIKVRSATYYLLIAPNR